MSSEPANVAFALVLSDLGNPVAAAVYRELRRRGEPVELVVGEELALARRWEHRVDDHGVSTRIELQDGRVLSERTVRAVFNRLRGTTVPQFARASEVDRAYAASEMHALLTSWLSSLRCPVANAACARGLSGLMATPAEWACRAARAGLRIRRQVLATRAGAFHRGALVPHRFPAWGTSVDAAPLLEGALLGDEPVAYLEPIAPSLRRILVVGSEVLGAPDPSWEERCRVLARESRVVVLGLSIAPRERDGEWVVAGVDPHPLVLVPRAIDAMVRWVLSLGRGGDA